MSPGVKPPMVQVLTLGETMVLFEAVGEGEPTTGTSFRMHVAGAESNFAVGLCRLGVGVRWISRVGGDPFGDLMESTLREEGVDTSCVRRDDAAPTAVFFKWHTPRGNEVRYYRRGSAAARLEAADVPEAAFDGVRLVHLTGITLALGAAPRQAVLKLARESRARGLLVTFDPNFRPTLWDSTRAARESLEQVLPYVDWCLCGLDEGNRLFGTASAAELAGALRAGGVRDVALRVGAQGALVSEGSELTLVPPERLEKVVDEVGAGDGFDAGWAYGLLKGLPPTECARIANAVAGAALRGTGDWETLPHLEELERA